MGKLSVYFTILKCGTGMIRFRIDLDHNYINNIFEYL